jgi:predicted PurR-regulated permease PerM
MVVNILLLIIIFLSLIFIIFIISKKFFSLINIDLEQIPAERAAKIKKYLLKKKINRQIEGWQNKLREKQGKFKDYLKKIKNYLVVLTSKTLIFFKNKIEFIKSKYNNKTLR